MGSKSDKQFCEQGNERNLASCGSFICRGVQAMDLRLDSQMSNKKGTHATFFLTMRTLMIFFSLSAPPCEAMNIEVCTTLSVLIRIGLQNLGGEGKEHTQNS